MLVRRFVEQVRGIFRRIADDLDSPTVRELNRRPGISDAEFYATYYANSEVTPDVARRVRAVLAEQLDFRGLRPEDNLATLFPDIPFDYVCEEVGEDFDVDFPSCIIETLDGTVDSVIRSTQTLVNRRTDRP